MTNILILLTTVSQLTYLQTQEIKRGYPGDMSSCAMAELSEIQDYGDQKKFTVIMKDDSVKFTDGKNSVTCFEDYRIETGPGYSYKNKHSEMDYF